MAEYPIRPLQMRLLPMMDAFHALCQAHGLKYYLWAGTMLGAVRHQGFIPWDDDMDVAMPREDLELLLQNWQSWLPQPYEIDSFRTNPDNPSECAKLIDSSTTLIERKGVSSLRGIYIDIFPLDEVPKSAVKRRWLALQAAVLGRLLYYHARDPYRHGHGASSWVPLAVQHLTSSDKLHHRLRRVMTQAQGSGSGLLLDYDDGIRGVVTADVIGQGTPIVFEGRQYMGVDNPQSYLSTKYGPDYMTPPAENQRRMHNFYYLDYDKPYREYQP